MLPTFQSIIESKAIDRISRRPPNVAQYLSTGFKEYVLKRISEIPDAQSASTNSSNDTQSEDKKYDSPSQLVEPPIDKTGACPALIQPIICPCIVPIYITAGNTNDPRIGGYTKEQRKGRIQKYKAKIRKYNSIHKKSRQFKGRSLIACTKPRVNGRFIKNTSL